MSRAHVITLSGVGLSILLAIGAAVIFVLGQSSVPGPGDSAPGQRRTVESSAPAAPGPADEPSRDRTAVSADEDEPPPLSVVSVRGRVVDAAGTPVPGIDVGVLLEDGDPPILGKSDGAGSFLLAAAALPCFVVVVDPKWTTLRMGEVSVEAPLAPALVIAAPAVTVGGIVVGEDGRPLAGAHLGIRLEKGALAELPGDPGQGFRGEWNAESAADGTFTFARAPAIARARLSTRLAEFRTDERTLDLPPPERLRIVLAAVPPEGPVLTGTVVHQDGSAASGASVSFGSARTRSDIRGRFRLVCGWYDAATPLVAAARRSSPLILPAYGAQVEREARELPPERLVLPGLELSITGRVLLANGGPAKGWRVALADATRLDPGGASTDFVEGLAGFRIDVRTDARGGFDFGGLADRPYTILASGRDRSSRAEVLVRSDPVPAGSRDVVLQAPEGNPGDTITGRVLTAAGRPVADARIGLGRPALRGSGSEYGMQGRFRAVSDAGGRFEIPGVPAGLATLVIVGESFLPMRLPLEPGQPRADLVVRVRERRELSFDGSSSSPQPDLLRVIAGGVPASVWRLDAATPRPAELLRLEGGVSGSIAVGEDVREIVLYRGCREIGRVPLVLGAEGPTRVVWP